MLFTALLFGQMGFQFSTSTENVGFMLFIFCVGIEAGAALLQRLPARRHPLHHPDLVILLERPAAHRGAGKFFNLGPGMAAGIPAGRSPPPGAGGRQDALRSGLLNLPHQTDMQSVLDNMGIGYALTYLVGLVGLMLVVRYLPSLARLDLQHRGPEDRPRAGPLRQREPQDLPAHHPRLSGRPGARRLDRRSHPCERPASTPHRLLCGADPPQRHTGQPGW